MFYSCITIVLYALVLCSWYDKIKRNNGLQENTFSNIITEQNVHFSGAMIQSNSIQSRSYYFTHFSEIMQTVADSNLVWKLCYRASYHGWAASIFHSNCDGKRDTVTIIRKDRYVFGGYTDIPWGKNTYIYKKNI